MEFPVFSFRRLFHRTINLTVSDLSLISSLNFFLLDISKLMKDKRNERKKIKVKITRRAIPSNPKFRFNMYFGNMVIGVFICQKLPTYFILDCNIPTSLIHFLRCVWGGIYIHICCPNRHIDICAEEGDLFSYILMHYNIYLCII